MVMEVSRMTEDAIRERLIGHGKTLFAKPRGVVEFTKLAPANLLLNDLDGHPHAFVLACVMDRQIKAERAWLIPHRISEKLGGFSMDTLVQLSQKEVFRLMSRPVPLHRFADTMSRLFHAAVQRIAEEYAGDASSIWANRPSSAEVVCRFLQFDGVGPKIATMAANILARDYKVPFSDYYSIDILRTYMSGACSAALAFAPPMLRLNSWFTRRGRSTRNFRALWTCRFGRSAGCGVGPTILPVVPVICRTSARPCQERNDAVGRLAQLLVRIFTASRGRLLTGSGEASVFTSIALPSCRAIWRA
jgi:hypothetical protein